MREIEWEWERERDIKVCWAQILYCFCIYVVELTNSRTNKNNIKQQQKNTPIEVKEGNNLGSNLLATACSGNSNFRFYFADLLKSQAPHLPFLVMFTLVWILIKCLFVGFFPPVPFAFSSSRVHYVHM